MYEKAKAEAEANKTSYDRINQAHKDQQRQNLELAQKNRQLAGELSAVELKNRYLTTALESSRPNYTPYQEQLHTTGVEPRRVDQDQENNKLRARILELEHQISILWG